MVGIGLILENNFSGFRGAAGRRAPGGAGGGVAG